MELRNIIYSPSLSLAEIINYLEASYISSLPRIRHAILIRRQRQSSDLLPFHRAIVTLLVTG